MHFFGLFANLPTETGGSPSQGFSTIDCSASGDIGKIISFARFIVDIIKIALPIGLILMGTLDLTKAVMGGKEEEIKKGQELLVKRFIYAIIAFFVVAVVTTLMQVIGDEQWKACWNNETVKLCFEDNEDSKNYGDKKACTVAQLFMPGHMSFERSVRFVCGTSSGGINLSSCLQTCSVDGDSVCAPSTVNENGMVFTASDKDQTICARTKDNNGKYSATVCTKLSKAEK